MLEHYHMSFLLTTENGNFLLYPIMFKNQIMYKADGLHSDVKNLELQGFYDSFCYLFPIPLSRVVGSQVMIDGHLRITAVHESALFSFIFF